MIVAMITRTTLIMMPTILMQGPMGVGDKGLYPGGCPPADGERVAGDAAVGAGPREGGVRLEATPFTSAQAAAGSPAGWEDGQVRGHPRALPPPAKGHP